MTAQIIPFPGRRPTSAVKTFTINVLGSKPVELTITDPLDDLKEAWDRAMQRQRRAIERPCDSGDDGAA